MIRGFVLSKTMSRAGTHSLRDFIDEVVDFAETLLRRRLRLVVLLACVWFAAVLYVGSKAVRGPVLRRRHRRPPQPGPDSEGSLCEVARPPPSGALRRLQHRLLSAVGWSGREPVKGRPAPARGPWRSGLYDVKGYCNLSSLAHFLAEVPWDRLAALCGAGQCYERMRHYGRFLEHLVPYVIAPPGPLAVTRRPVPLEAAGDCGHPDWARLFTGAQRPQRLQVCGRPPPPPLLGLTQGRSWILLSPGCNSRYYRVAHGTGVIPNETQFPCRTLKTRSRSSAVIHVTPELEVLGSIPAGAISRNAVSQALRCP